MIIMYFRINIFVVGSLDSVLDFEALFSMVISPAYYLKPKNNGINMLLKKRSVNRRSSRYLNNPFVLHPLNYIAKYVTDIVVFYPILQNAVVFVGRLFNTPAYDNYILRKNLSRATCTLC